MTQVALNLKELLPSSKQSYFIVVMIRTVLVLSILFVALAVAFFGETVGFDYPGLGCIPVSSTVPGIYQDMIITSSGTSEGERREEKRFLYDIVAHGRNGIHVDKLMESMRVMDKSNILFSIAGVSGCCLGNWADISAGESWALGPALAMISNMLRYMAVFRIVGRSFRE